MALKIRLKQYKNSSKSSFGKYYAETVLLDEVHTADIARLVSDNTTFRPGEVKGIIDEVVAVMTKQLQDGNAVVLDGLGRFRLMVESKGVEKPEEFNLGRHLKRIVCKFLPASRRIGDDGTANAKGRKEQLFCEGAEVEWYR